jgi:flagellin-like hook-associated protein FlgL
MSLSVSSSKGSVLQEPQVTIKEEKITKQTGYYSSIYAKVDGKNITEPVKIDEWNDELNFVYKENGNSHSVSMKLDEKEYTFDELRQALQDNIDAQIGAGELTVDVTGAGVVIKANNPGNKYSFNRNDFSGDFFYKVMNTAKEVTANQRPTVSNGTAPKDTAYTVGRKDVRNKSTEIKAGINDTLSLDFTYGNTTTTFTVKLDPGTYSGQELKNMLQEKLNDEVVKAGLSENIIEVGIGGISTGVVGANDNNALNFQLSKSVRLPADGTYVIDGVKGNAAFSIFYQTDGELVPAYVKGAKDLTEGVTIESGKQDFSMDVEGTNYSISLEAKKYTADEILTEINGKLGAAGAPVTAELEDGILKFSHNKLGERKIENVTGGAKQALFFNENGEKGEKEEIRIQMSSRAGDYITIDRPILNTVKLGVNSIAITSPKYANKALVRIDEAINHVSQVRSDFGAKQNRLEFAVNSNKNTSENTQAAESLLRDADMADEMMTFSKESIIIQAGEAMMAQANSLKEGVLRLLNF